MSRKGYWRLSKTLATQTAMTNACLQQQGLLSIRRLWMKVEGYIKPLVLFARLHKAPVEDPHGRWCRREVRNTLLDPIRSYQDRKPRTDLEV